MRQMPHEPPEQIFFRTSSFFHCSFSCMGVTERTESSVRHPLRYIARRNSEIFGRCLFAGQVNSRSNQVHMQITYREASRTDIPQIVAFQIRMALETESINLDETVVTAGVAAVFDDHFRGRYYVA